MKYTYPQRRLSVLFLAAFACIAFLFNNCGGFTSAPLRTLGDYLVVGPDGVPDSSQNQPRTTSQTPQEKIYWNDSGDASTAPRWQGKTINWYYNPTGQPSAFNENDVLAMIQKGVETWQAVCGVKWVYMGKTTHSSSVYNDGVNTIGWGAASGMAGYTYSSRVGLNFSESDIEFSNSQLADATALQGMINHELGHNLGLKHSDVVESIMFANPYHPPDYMLTLRDDDISGCVGLYGAAAGAPAPAPSPTPRQSATPSPTPAPTSTPGIKVAPPPVSTPAIKATPTPTPMATPVPKPTATAAPLPTATPGPKPTATPVPSATPLPRTVSLPTPTPAPAPSATPFVLRPPPAQPTATPANLQHLLQPRPTATPISLRLPQAQPTATPALRWPIPTPTPVK